MGNSLLQKPLNWVRGGFIAHLVLSLASNLYSTPLAAWRLLAWLSYVPVVLFLLYLFVGYPKNPRHPLLLATFISQAMYRVFWHYGNREFIWILVDGLGSFSLYEVYLDTFLLFNLTVVVMAVAGIINYATRFKYLRVSLVAVIVSGAVCTVYQGVGLWVNHLMLYSIGYFVSMLLYHAALVLFWWRVAVPRTAAANANPRLYALWQQLDRGQISAEEYDRRRAELMNQ